MVSPESVSEEVLQAHADEPRLPLVENPLNTTHRSSNLLKRVTIFIAPILIAGGAYLASGDHSTPAQANDPEVTPTQAELITTPEVCAQVITPYFGPNGDGESVDACHIPRGSHPLVSRSYVPAAGR